MICLKGCELQDRRSQRLAVLSLLTAFNWLDTLLTERGGEMESNLPPALWPSTDLIVRIFSQLDCVDLLHCSLVCKQWYRDSAELREGWKNEYMEAYTLFGLCIKRETHPPSATCSIRGLHSWCP